MVILGGYTATITAGIQPYDPTKTNSFWIDIASDANSILPGFFLGTTKKNGINTAATAMSCMYKRGLNGSRVVHNVCGMSGRVDFKKNKFRVSPGLAYTKEICGNSNLFAEFTTNMKKNSNFRAMFS